MAYVEHIEEIPGMGRRFELLAFSDKPEGRKGARDFARVLRECGISATANCTELRYFTKDQASGQVHQVDVGGMLMQRLLAPLEHRRRLTFVDRFFLVRVECSLDVVRMLHLPFHEALPKGGLHTRTNNQGKGYHLTKRAWRRALQATRIMLSGDVFKVLHSASVLGATFEEMNALLKQQLMGRL